MVITLMGFKGVLGGMAFYGGIKGRGWPFLGERVGGTLFSAREI
jgi:hypothetical protein